MDGGLAAAGDGRRVRYVVRRFVRLKRRQFTFDRNALMQLPQFRFSQKVRQLQLSDQDDLQQLRIMCFEIRNDSNLFECRERKVLSLVDDEDSPAFFLQNGNEKFIQR